MNQYEMVEFEPIGGAQRENLLHRLRSVNCSILKNGYRKSFNNYIFCSCDPDLQDPICEECYNKCHNGHSIMHRKNMKALCNCGSKSHQINSMNYSAESNINSERCPMMEWYSTINSEFYYSNLQTRRVCLFCANFCEENFSNLTKIDFKNQDVSNKNSNNCECNNKNHYDSKLILKKLRDCQNLHSYNFEGISKTHFVNMILKSETSFNQLFTNYKVLLEKCKKKLQSFESTPNISTTFLTETTISQTFNLYLSVFATLTKNLNRLNYINQKIASDYNMNFILNLMKIPTEYNSINVWNFKLNLLTIFINTNFKREFSIAPNLTTKDLELLSPFQRLMYINNIKSQNELVGKYINNLNTNFLEFTLKVLNQLNMVKDKFNVSYKLIRKFINICKNYAKFNLFNYDQAMKYTAVIDDLIIKFSILIKNSNNEGNMKELMLEEQIYLIKPIIKSLIYLNYYYNDQVTEKFLKNHNSNLKFFNSQLELTKFLSKNFINCLTNILNNQINDRFKKEIKTIISNISTLLKNFITTRDGYSTGLKRILNRNSNIHFKYLSDVFSANELNFVNNIRILTNQIESDYYKFFNYELDEKTLITNLQATIKNLFDSMNLSSYRQATLITEHMYSSFSEKDNENEKSNFNYIILSQTPEKFSIFPRQNTLNHLPKNENENLFEKSENNALGGSDLENYMKNNYDTIAKYKLLINKSFLIFSYVKIIKILHSRHSNIPNKKDADYNSNNIDQIYSKNVFKIDEGLFADLIKLLHFYIENNQENSIIIMSSDFLEAFSLLNENQLNEILGIVYLCLKNIIKLKFELANYKNIIKFMKVLLKNINLNQEKFSIEYKILIKVLKLLKLVTKINFLDEIAVANKMRKFLVFLFDKYQIISEFIDFLVKIKNPSNAGISEYETDLISDQYNRGNTKNNRMLILKDAIAPNFINEIENKKEFNGENYKEKINVDAYRDSNFKNQGFSNIILNENFDDVEISGVKVKDLSVILRYFLSLINILFDGDATLNKKEFLSSIFNLNDIYLILQRKNIDLSLRKQILVFFRMVYVDVIFEKSKIEDYLNVLVDKKSKNENRNSFGTSDVNTLFSFYDKLIRINEKSANYHLEYKIIKEELLNYQIIFEMQKNYTTIEKLEYFIEGIIQPIKTHMSKFLCKINDFTGSDYLKLYELVYYFLVLKDTIINNSEYLNLVKKRYKFRDIFQISELKTVETFIPIEKSYSQSTMIELHEHIQNLKNPAFKFYEYEFLINLYNYHMDTFVLSNKSDSLKKYFLKKNNEFEDDEIIELEKNLMKSDFLKYQNEKQAFKLIVSYYNSKRNLSNSGFMNTLEDNNLQYSNSYRYLIIRSIFYILRDERFKDHYSSECYWNLFKLIQYDTEFVQKEIIKLIDEPIDMVDLRDLTFVFVENFVSIIFTSCNSSANNSNTDYFLAMNLVKFLKYLCEDHNKEFQRIFFKEINLIKSFKKIDSNNHKHKHVINDHYDNENHKEEKEKEEDSFNKEPHHNKNLANEHGKMSISLKHAKKSSHHVRIREEVNINEGEFLSVFELMLEVVNKIILIAKWNCVGFNTKNNNVAYYYDIFSVVIEFLIEMIQGTEAGNLETLIYKKSHKLEKDINDENDLKIILFLNNVKPVLLRDETDSIIVYQVRKDLIDFVCAFLEEKSTPKKLIKIISNIFNPSLVFLSIVNTMKKLYLRLMRDEFLQKTSLSYKEIEFDKNVCNFFETRFFRTKNFTETPEFELSNRMYQFLKILSTEYLNSDAIDIIDIVYSQQLKGERHSKIQQLKDSKDNKKSQDESYFITNKEKYYCVKFFEKITRTVMVQNDDDLIRVVFTVNPLIKNLSTNSKSEFYQNVNRETRYIKLFSLMEYCDYFYDEIMYNSTYSDSNCIMKFLNKINYFSLEFFTFFINLIINILMIFSLQKGEEIEGDDNISIILVSFAILNLVFCFVVIIFWIYSKFPLYWKVDSKKLALKLNIPVDQLTIWHKIKVLRDVIFFRNEITSFLWHIAFCASGISDFNNQFLFTLEILIMVNLSSMLKNIVKSVTLRYNQLLVTLMLFMISNYQFGVFAFYFFAEDFVTNFKILPFQNDKDHLAEKTISMNQCGNVLYCFITHLDYGLRSDGGIGEYIPKKSLLTSPGYYMGRFFHNVLYFIIVNVVIFSILMGIIIDTFAELRELTTKKEEDMENVCYICGDLRENLEKNSQNFLVHTQKVHNLWVYAEYIIGLKFLDPQETNAINSYVIGTVQQKAISWFPQAQSEEGENQEKHGHGH